MGGWAAPGQNHLSYPLLQFGKRAHLTPTIAPRHSAIIRGGLMLSPSGVAPSLRIWLAVLGSADPPVFETYGRAEARGMTTRRSSMHGGSSGVPLTPFVKPPRLSRTMPFLSGLYPSFIPYLTGERWGTNGMRVAKSVLLAAALIMIPITAAAQERWRRLGSTADGSVVFVDIATALRAERLVTVWVRVVLPAPISRDGLRWDEVRLRVRYDCWEVTAQPLTEAFYLGGTQVRSETISASPQTVTGGVDGAVSQVVCSPLFS